MTDPTPCALNQFRAAIDSGDDKRAEDAVFTLSDADEAALVEMALQDEGDRQWWAVRALAEFGGASAAPALAATLTTPDANLRATTALAIGHVGQRKPEAVEPILPALARLLEDPDGFVRQAAVDGLSLCGEVSLPVLVQVLTECTHQGARTRAASAVRNLHSMKAAPILFQCLGDENPMVRTYAYEALDELGLLESLLLLP
jgi:HEAT repeat protein